MTDPPRLMGLKKEPSLISLPETLDEAQHLTGMRMCRNRPKLARQDTGPIRETCKPLCWYTSADAELFQRSAACGVNETIEMWDEVGVIGIGVIAVAGKFRQHIADVYREIARAIEVRTTFNSFETTGAYLVPLSNALLLVVRFIPSMLLPG